MGIKSLPRSLSALIRTLSGAQLADGQKQMFVTWGNRKGTFWAAEENGEKSGIGYFIDYLKSSISNLT